MNVLFLTRYGQQGASSRIRTFQYLPFFKSEGVSCVVSVLFNDSMLLQKYRNGGYRFYELLASYLHRVQVLARVQQFDLVWIEKEALPWFPAWFERLLLSRAPYVLDFDDAIFHRYDQHANSIVRQLLGRRLDKLIANAALVIGGNNYLAQHARDTGAARVEVLPTVIDLLRYPPKPSTFSPIYFPLIGTDTLPRVVWIGSPSTVHYLRLLCEPLKVLNIQQPFVLRIIGGGAVDLPGVQVESIPWAEASEVESISACQVGVMPLRDSLWERGKCGYKLIQYMACGLPVVASGVGVNPEIVRNGENGFLASTPQEWVHALGKLLSDPSLRMQMGAAGRKRVEEYYCLQKTGPRIMQLLRSITRRR